MKKILCLSFLFLIFASCQKNKMLTDESVCIDNIWNYEDPKSSSLPYVGIKLKIEDSSTLKKIEGGKLSNIILYNLDKKYSQFFKLESFGIGRQFKKKGSFLMFKIQTFIFSGSPNNYLAKWADDDIEKVFQGEIGLVFDKDTIFIVIK